MQKENPKPRNAEKKARQFDLSSMFAETVQTARNRTELSQSTKETDHEEEARDRLRNIYIPSGGSSQDDNDEIGPPVPSGLNTQTEENEDEDFFPPLPPGFVPDTTVIADANEASQLKSATKPDDDDDEYEEPITVTNLIPAACEVVIKHSNKPITAICFDHQGSKFAVGGYNYAVQLFEFQKMDMSMKPFREIYPCESHIINSLAFSTNGENLLVASGNAQLKLLDRNGQQWCETVRGDQYLVDLANTKGHTSAVNCCQWHPLNKKEFLSCADDGTLRIWSLDDYKEITKCINTQQKVIKTRNAGGKRAIPTACCYSNDGRLIGVGCDDGSIHIWKHGKIYVNTTYLNRTAHSGPITCLAFSPDGEKILSRSLDDTMKLFELKNFKQPLQTATDLPNLFPQTDCGFSPHGEFIFTGTSTKSKAGESGSLLFFNSDNFDLLYRINFDSSVSCWPVRRARESEVIKEDLILSPLTLDMFQARGEEDEEKEVTEWRLKRYLRMLSNNKRPQFRKPAEMPMSGPSMGGRIAASGGTLHSYIAKEIGVQTNKALQPQQDEDVRTAILKHADAAEKDPQFITKAYRKTQPKPIFQEKTTAPEEEQEDEDLMPMYKVARLG
uniref:Gastrulation defective protein 1 n=1 Tax=Acrobeloides nanus TaxID=290746 RepID=A0A914BW91_9BILA